MRHANTNCLAAILLLSKSCDFVTEARLTLERKHTTLKQTAFFSKEKVTFQDALMISMIFTCK